MIKLKVKRLHPTSVLPTIANPNDAGFDLWAVETCVLSPGARVQVPTGIALEIPEGYVGLIWDKSGLSQKHGLKTLGGVVDAGYRGEVLVGIVNLSEEPYTIEAGHKVAQMIIQRREEAEIVETEELSSTERGAGGFGSTGK